MFEFFAIYLHFLGNWQVDRTVLVEYTWPICVMNYNDNCTSTDHNLDHTSLLGCLWACCSVLQVFCVWCDTTQGLSYLGWCTANTSGPVKQSSSAVFNQCYLHTGWLDCSRLKILMCILHLDWSQFFAGDPLKEWKKTIWGDPWRLPPWDLKALRLTEITGNEQSLPMNRRRLNPEAPARHFNALSLPHICLCLEKDSDLICQANQRRKGWWESGLCHHEIQWAAL